MLSALAHNRTSSGYSKAFAPRFALDLHRARQLMSLGLDVRLMPPAYVKPYVHR